MTMGTVRQTQILLDQPNFLDYLYALLNHEKKVIRAETCWILCNIASGNSEQVNTFLARDDLIGEILHLF